MDLERKILNSTVDDPKDAYDAWAHLAARLDDLPPGAQKYFAKLCNAVAEFDPHDDEEIALTNQLETPVLRSKKRKGLGAKSKHDYAHIFDWVVQRERMTGGTTEQAIWEYTEKFDLDPDNFETVKSAYYKVGRARAMWGP